MTPRDLRVFPGIIFKHRGKLRMDQTLTAIHHNHGIVEFASLIEDDVVVLIDRVIADRQRAQCVIAPLTAAAREQLGEMRRTRACPTQNLITRPSRATCERARCNNTGNLELLSPPAWDGRILRAVHGDWTIGDQFVLADGDTLFVGPRCPEHCTDDAITRRLRAVFIESGGLVSARQRRR